MRHGLESGNRTIPVYQPEHVGPKYPAELAIPIIEDGVFIDLSFINDEMSYTRTTCRAAVAVL
jgi:hypothetical protein